MKNEVIHARISSDIKKECESILSNIGLSMSQAIDLYIRQIVLKKGIPFELNEIENETKNNSKAIFNICFDYSSRNEIIDAIKRIKDIDEIDQETFNKYLYHDLPPIDFLIRTSGEMRLSDFMLWQSAYAELYFPETLFPDFNNEEFDKAIEIYNKRSRRYGGL